MKRLLVACLLAVLAAPAFAVIGTVDDVPAATLLLPYFEVDLDNPNGVTTLMSVNNASASAVLAHVVMWTDVSNHVLDFDIYLTGYDVQTINLRDIIVGGLLPVTADLPNDPTDGISPQGPASDDSSYSPRCDEFLPYGVPALSADFLEHLQSSLTGGPSSYFGNKCMGIDHGDRIARGYVTVDTVADCSVAFPGDDSYLQAADAGIVTFENVLWGDYFYVNPSENFAQGETLVHIEADTAALAPNIGAYTFYYRYTTPSVGTLTCASGGDLGCDSREGLGNVFAARYVDGGGFTGGTDFLVWRDAKRAVAPFVCADDYPAGFPLGLTQVVMFDEEEDFETPEFGCTVSPCPPPDEQPNPFPWEAQRVEVGGADLPVSYDFGWAYLNLNFDTGALWPVPETYLMQNWVTVTMDADGRFSVGFDAIQLGNVTFPATAPNDCIEIGGPIPCPID